MKSRDRREPREKSEFEEKVIEVRRISRTVAGGRRIRFRALLVIGNKKGKVGMGLAKANDVQEAVRKAVDQAKRNTIEVPIVNGTIPHEVNVKYGAARLMIRPATPGTSIVAGGSVRAVADLAGITDLLAKMMGSANKVNNIIAVMKAFSSFSPIYTEKVREMTKRFEEDKNEKTETELPTEENAVKEETKEVEVEKKKKPAKKVSGTVKNKRK